ncbi:hypothetical protein [Ilumatobacter sp.]|uniref:hypothetical protein n=1 Tax=Ilumatobacter sp. TaxID=1967498 RepID=UPI003B51ACC4
MVVGVVEGAFADDGSRCGECPGAGDVGRCAQHRVVLVGGGELVVVDVEPLGLVLADGEGVAGVGSWDLVHDLVVAPGCWVVPVDRDRFDEVDVVGEDGGDVDAGDLVLDVGRGGVRGRVEHGVDLRFAGPVRPGRGDVLVGAGRGGVCVADGVVAA